MAVTREALSEGGSKQTVASTPTTNIATPTGVTSLFGSSPPKDVAAPSKNLKRKANDPKLQVVCIDTMHDLCLIVGTPDSPGGQKAFQVNEASIWHASSVWSTMLSGNWAESGMPEIFFPDDSCYAFEIVLRIVHLQFSELPASLTRVQLIDIAKLADKYNIGQVFPAVVEFKKWLHPYRDSAGTWPADTDYQAFAIITSAFKLQADFKYLVNRLAMHVYLDESDKYFYYDSKHNKIVLRSDLPPRVTGTTKYQILILHSSLDYWY
jgi:hypothetical protein